MEIPSDSFHVKSSEFLVNESPHETIVAGLFSDSHVKFNFQVPKDFKTESPSTGMTGTKFLSNGQEKKQQKRSNYANTVDGQKCADLHQNITTRTMTIQTKNLAERKKGERNVVHHTVKIETSSPQAWRGLHTRKISVEQSMKSTAISKRKEIAKMLSA